MNKPASFRFSTRPDRCRAEGRHETAMPERLALDNTE